jgi:uncharacterized membrane protein
MNDLGPLPSGYIRGKAFAVSADGSVIVGTVGPDSGGRNPFVWTESDGVRLVDDVFVSHGLDLSGWTLESARDVSDDGRTIVGWGRNPSGDLEGWIAVIPEPSTAFLMGLDLGEHGMHAYDLSGSSGFMEEGTTSGFAAAGIASGKLVPSES